jgi:hypothetical protein
LPAPLLQVKSDNPGAGFAEISKLMGEKWKSMSAEDKAPYEAQAKEVGGGSNGGGQEVPAGGLLLRS